MAVKRKKKKRIKLKTSFKRFMVFFAFFVWLTIYVCGEITRIKVNYAYRETDEYKLINHGYTKKESKLFLDKLSKERITFLLENEMNENYYNLVRQKYFLEKNFDAYLEYKKDNRKADYPEIITSVNVHANYDWYGITFKADTTLDEKIFVNKYYKLDDDYKRDDLEDIPLTVAYQDQKISSIVLTEYLKMREDIYNEMNVRLMVNSSYRSFEDQQIIYNSFKMKGQSYADAYAARPGFSEHQTGLALDITSLEHKGQAVFTESEEYKWLKENCYKYGFILRYPEDCEHITGYNTESWHFRYVGKELAKKIYDEDITFDEYYAFYME